MADRNYDGRTLWNPLSGIIRAAGAPAGTGGAAGDMNKLAVAITAGQTLIWVIKCFLNDNISIQINWTGTLKGVFTVLQGLDYSEFENGTNQVAGNWLDITANAVAKIPFVTKLGTDPSGANTGPLIINIQHMPGPFIQLLYTADATTPGSGTMTGWTNAKGL